MQVALNKAGSSSDKETTERKKCNDQHLLKKSFFIDFSFSGSAAALLCFIGGGKVDFLCLKNSGIEK